jgi:inner membrane protein
MATPIGHALAGYAVSSFSTEKQNRNRFHLILLCIFMAVAPDLDVLPGLLRGKPILYHSAITHSLGFGFVLSLAIAGIYHLRGRSFSDIFKLCFISYSSHLFLDFFGPDGRVPYGIPLFWPLSGMHFISPIPLLLGTRHVGSTSASTLEFIKGVLSFYNLAAILLEVVLIVPLVFLGRRYRHRKWQRLVKPINPQLPDQLQQRNI